MFVSCRNLTAQIPNYVPSNGLVGWWPFNGSANDESGNGNNGVINGVTLVADRFGNANQAYSFNGATEVGSDNTIVVVDNGIDIPNFSVNFSKQYNYFNLGKCCKYK
ncbi:MAG: hypothetical protein IPJ26_13910 [Bacteroidetes bacterium]|nr:hypothetical protein [Bacteroidota bacterium]